MATFLDDLSIYNAKAAAAITLAATTGDSGKANLMSSLKSTANDTSLTEEVRLNALTALINVGNLLDIPLPPYFPITTTFANTQTYTGLHNDLIGLDVEPYLHITTAEKSFYANKANLSDISFTNLLGAYTSNAGLTSAINAKQNALNGTGFVKASGGTITYDNSTYLTSISGIVAGGDLDGTYPNPTLRNTSVTGQALTGFNGSASTGTITGADTILSAFETLNANVNNVIASSGTITSVSFALPSSVFSYTAGPFTSGAANLSGTFVNQSQNRFFAGPSSGGAGQPDFRAIVAGDFPASGAMAGSYGSSSSIPVITVDTYGRVTNISSVASASGGQVNTITYSVPAGVFTSTVTGTTAVGITLGLEQQTANTVWAGPASGAAATPGFRSLVALDIPDIAISQVTNLQNELDSKMTFLLNDGEIWIGNASNAPTNQSLTGDVTMTRDGVVTIEDEAVIFAKMQNITSGNLLGRWDASTPGPIQQISLSADFDLDSGTGILSLAVPVAPILNSKGGLITYRQSIGQQVQLTAVFDGNLLITDTAEDDGLKWVTAQGDIEVDVALDGTFNILPGVVTLGKMANLAANSFIGNNTGSSATPIALTVTQATAMLNQFTTSAKGLAPGVTGPAVGDATYFLNATGGWSQPAGGGGTTTNALTIGSGLSGTAGTFNGSAAVTVSLNTANANTWTALQTFENNIYLGAAGGTSGSVRFRGSTSGYVILQAAASPANQTYILPTANGTTGQFLKLSDSGTGQLAWDTAGSGSGTVNAANQYSIPYYSTAGSATVLSGLAPQTTNGVYFLRANVTVSAAVAPDWLGSTGSGNVVLATSPTLTTPDIGVATATSINKVAITAPATSATLTIADGKTLTINESLTLSASSSASVAFGAGGTVAYVGLANTWTAGIKQTFAPSATTAGINVGTLAGQPSSPANGDLVYNSSATALQAYINGAWVSLGSGGGVTSFQTSLSGLTPSTATTGVVTLAGTLGVASGGTGATSLTAYAVLCGGTTSTGAVQSIASVGTAGQVLTSNGAGALPTFQTLSTTATLTNIGAATTTASLTNALSVITWNWNSNTSTNSFVLGSTGLTSGSLFTLTHTTSALTGNLASFTSSSVSSGTLLNLGITGTGAAAKNLVITNASTGNTTGRGIDVLISGATGASQTYGAYISNTKSGSTVNSFALYLNASGAGTNNYGLQVNASGATTNYALDVVAGISRFGVGTASVPQLILTPSSAITISGTVNGSIWYDTASSNSSLTLYKDSAYTKIITTARNPDFAVGSASGVIVADTSGTLTKSADLTALGIYAQTNDVTVVNTTTATTLIGTVVGSATLPANFFAAGKTIIIFISGTYQQASGSNTCTLNFSIGGVAVGSIALNHNNTLAASYFEARVVVTCRTAGATGTVQYQGCGLLDLSGTPEFYYITPATSGSINTTTTNAINVTATWSAANPSNSLVAGIHTAQYIN